jgi:hypothetical protein
MGELQIPQITEFIEQYRRNCKDQSAGFQRVAYKISQREK